MIATLGAARRPSCCPSAAGADGTARLAPPQLAGIATPSVDQLELLETQQSIHSRPSAECRDMSLVVPLAQHRCLSPPNKLCLTATSHHQHVDMVTWAARPLQVMPTQRLTWAAGQPATEQSGQNTARGHGKKNHTTLGRYMHERSGATIKSGRRQFNGMAGLIWRLRANVCTSSAHTSTLHEAREMAASEAPHEYQRAAREMKA